MSGFREYWVLITLPLFFAALIGIRSQTCTLPQALRGRNLVSNAVGAVTINETSIVFEEGFRDCDFAERNICRNAIPLVFHCLENRDDVYYFKSQRLTQDGKNTIYAYMCWYFTHKISDQKWVYYQAPKDFMDYYKSYVFSPGIGKTASFDLVCDLGSPLPVNKHSILLDTASLPSQSTSCPDALLGTFNASACVTEFDVCSTTTRQTILLSDSSCGANVFFSVDGKMDCLYSLSENGVTYVTMFTPESPNVTFPCMAYIEQGGTVYINMNKTSCDILQPPTVASYDVSLAPLVLCPFPCTFPSELSSGTWKNSRTGQEVTLNSTALSNFFSCGNPNCSGAVDSLECYRTEGSRYLVRTPVTTVKNESVRVYMCLELTQLSSTKYLYYQLHQNVQATVNDYAVIFNSGQSVSLTDACEDLSARPLQATRHHIFLQSGSETTSFDACPDFLLGEFSNGKCQSFFDTCDDETQLKLDGKAFNCTTKPLPFFTDGASTGCLHSVTDSDTTYVTLYNADASADGSTTFAFTCVALKANGDTVKLSQNPLECVDSQTADNITTAKGTLFTYEKTGDCSSEFDFMIIIIVVVVVLVIIIIVLVIVICIVCRKKRAAKRKRKHQEDVDAILAKEKGEEEEDRGSNLSLDSGYPWSRGDSRTGPGGRVSRGTPRSHFAEVYEVNEEDPKEVNVIGHRRRRRRRFEPRGKDGAYETDGEAEYSDGSWEEYVDDDGNTQVRHKRRRRRRRKKVKQTYTRTHVLADGTTVEEEVESEYSVTASSDMTSSEDDRESLTDQIRAQKEKHRTRLQKIMDGPAKSTAVVVTREMDEKSHQPEKKRRSFFSRLRLKARDRKDRKTKVHQRRLFRREDGKAEVPGITGVEREIPYLLQYHKKKHTERILNDEGFFDDPNEKMTAETVFGFQATDRELSPKPSDFGGTVGEGDEGRMTTASDSSQSDGRPKSRGGSDAVSEAVEEEGVEAMKVTTRDKNRHVTIDPSGSRSPLSTTPSSDSSETKDGDSSGRKSSDTSGVADLSPSHQPSSPEQNHPSFAEGSGRDPRRVSMGWEKLHGLYARHRLSLHGGRDKDGAEGRGTSSRIGQGKSKQKHDKRVKTALRRLLNERLFGSSDKKKSRREDDIIGDNWTNADSVANNVSETSSVAGTRAGTRQTARPLTQGKVAFAELDSNHSDAKSHGQSAQRRNELSPARRFKQHGDHQQSDDDDNDKNGQERLPTGGGSRLPPLRNPTMSLDRVFTPANYPKWGLWVTASQRTMLVDGLHRDKTFLSRMQAQTAWSGKTEDGLPLPPSSSGTGKGDETTDDESYLDPHRPDTEEKGKENEEGEAWAHRRGHPPGGDHKNGGSVAFTKASGRSPLDIDDRRLRKLLEELYQDKKFMDKLINKIDEEHLEFPDHIASDDVKFLSEFGRHYLLERAQYWELHGPLGPPRPPPTALGMRLSRAQTSMTSDTLRQSSDESVESPRPKTVR